MELNHDWKRFQDIFYPRKRTRVMQSAEPTGPAYFVVDHGTVICAFAENEDLSEYLGTNWDDVNERMKHRKLISFEADEVDEWWCEAVGMPDIYNQFELLKHKAFNSLKVRSRIPADEELASTLTKKHFILQSLRSWWNKILPASYGLFIRIEGQASQDLFVVVRKGVLESFYEPDLTALGDDRSRQPSSIIKYLSEKNALPVQGLFVPSDEWDRWSNAQEPWKEMFTAINKKKARVFPNHPGMKLLVVGKAFLGV